MSRGAGASSHGITVTDVEVAARRSLTTGLLRGSSDRAAADDSTTRGDVVPMAEVGGEGTCPHATEVTAAAAIITIHPRAPMALPCSPPRTPVAQSRFGPTAGLLPSGW